MKVSLRLFGAGLMLAAGVVSAMAQSVTIDNFTSGPVNLGTNQVGYVQSSQNGTNIAGGQRDDLLQVTSDPYGRNATFTVVPNQGMAFQEDGTGVDSLLSLGYSGTYTQTNNGVIGSGPGLNLDLSKQNAFDLGFLSSDSPLNVEVDAYTYGGGKSVANFTLNPSTSNQDYKLNFSSFAPSSGTSGVDWSNVDKLGFVFHPTQSAADFGLAHIQAVPEPCSMFILGAGLVGVAFRRRKKAA